MIELAEKMYSDIRGNYDAVVKGTPGKVDLSSQGYYMRKVVKLYSNSYYSRCQYLYLYELYRQCMNCNSALKKQCFSLAEDSLEEATHTLLKLESKLK